MFSLEKISVFFETFVIYETELERLRIHLSSSPFFEPYNSFKEIDSSLSGFITADDIYSYLHKNRIRAELRYVFCMVKHYSSHSDGKIFVGDFLKFALPRTKLSLREDALKRLPTDLTPELRDTFLRIFLMEIEMWERIERIRYDISVIEELDLQQAFDEIDIPRSGFLSAGKIQRFLERFNRNYIEEQIFAVILRLDSDGDSMLSLEEFANCLNYRPTTKVKVNEEFTVEAEVEKRKTENFRVKRKSAESHNRSTNKKRVEISTDPELVILDFFNLLIELEDIVDKEKKKLIICPDFSIKEVIEIFDPNNLNFSTESDFFDGLESIGVKTNKEEIILLFKHYSEKYNKRLTHAQLAALFLPYLETSIGAKNCELHQDTIKKLKVLMEKHLQNEVLLEKYRQMWKKSNITSAAIFKALSKGKLASQDIQEIMRNRRDLNEKELTFIFQAFKKVPNEEITLQGFSQEFSPKSLTKF